MNKHIYTYSITSATINVRRPPLGNASRDNMVMKLCSAQRYSIKPVTHTYLSGHSE